MRHNCHVLPVVCVILYSLVSVVCWEGDSLSRPSRIGMRFRLIHTVVGVTSGCGCPLLWLFFGFCGVGLRWAVINLTPPPCRVDAQETLQPAPCLPLSAPDTRRATPKQRSSRQSKVWTQIPLHYAFGLCADMHLHLLCA